MRENSSIWSDPPLPEEYSRITHPERFRPLHTRALVLLEQLHVEYEVARTETFDALPTMSPFDHERAPISLTPIAATAAPIAVAFTPFPSLILRFGRWLSEPFPACPCDACAATADSEWERFETIVWSVVHGGLSEQLSLPLLRSPRLSWSFGSGAGWSKLPRALGQALGSRGWGRIRWQPWSRRLPSA